MVDSTRSRSTNNVQGWYVFSKVTFFQDWQNTQFLHVFQEQLITGNRFDAKTDDLYSLMQTNLGAMVDLQQSAVFEEPFYIVVLERTNNGTLVHMWRLLIASNPPNPGISFLSHVFSFIYLSKREVQ